MGIRLDRFTSEMVKMFSTAQHELGMQELENLNEFFEIILDDDGNITEMKAREITLNLIDREGHINAMDIIQERTSIVIDEAEIKFDVPISIVPTDDPEDDDGFVIETVVKSKGLFKDHSSVEMKIKVKGKPESQGMRFLRMHYHQHLVDELQGFGKKERGEDDA